MAINWDSVTARLSTRGPDGRLLSAIAGDETDPELRALVVRFAHGCPKNRQHAGCPFCALHHFYHLSLQNLLDGLPRKALVGLFELECEVRNTCAAAADVRVGAELSVDSDPAT